MVGFNPFHPGQELSPAGDEYTVPVTFRRAPEAKLDQHAKRRERLGIRPQLLSAIAEEDSEETQTPKSDTVQIHVEPDLWRVTQPVQRSYGSHVPMLKPMVNGVKRKHHSMLSIEGRKHTKRMAMMPAHGHGLTRNPLSQVTANADGQDEKELIKRLSGSYQWSWLEDPMDIWEWAQSRGYTSKWSKAQVTGFKLLLNLMNRTAASALKGAQSTGRVSRPNAKRLGKTLSDSLKTMGLGSLRVDMLTISSYRFSPVGRDFPAVHRRADLAELETKRIDRGCPQYWTHGQPAVSCSGQGTRRDVGQQESRNPLLGHLEQGFQGSAIDRGEDQTSNLLHAASGQERPLATTNTPDDNPLRFLQTEKQSDRMQTDDEEFQRDMSAIKQQFTQLAYVLFQQTGSFTSLRSHLAVQQPTTW
ncbi:hypothetical protein GMORB2_7599 [Geosmithia morbida]|uniref:Uncharacterized protein n=1 Tax=Geosmithia morbida TaxID=1094350 RepID=A0A9P4YUM8_9HYPO|nr:uncharacterized protein GMORB2_7599 [Geosmithia morbida]KAF4122006.1 hypothetical protein GMORB2_7599 [Geosmithia morbida]